MGQNVVVYHGSNHRFGNAKIVKGNTRDSSKLNEGYGVYFSLDITVAKSYGKYLYALMLDSDDIIDFRLKDNCKKLLNKIISEVKRETAVDISSCVNFTDILGGILYGDIGIHSIDREIMLHLDSNEKFYEKHNDKALKVESVLNGLAEKLLRDKAYLFTYNIKDVGIIKNDKLIKRTIRHKVA